jgi:hypothetical protein
VSATVLQRKFSRDRNRDVQSNVLQPGICTGVVVGSILPNRLINVKLDGRYEAVTCVWAAGIISGLLGVNSSYTPPAKTRVLIFYTGGKYSFIIGSYSSVLTTPKLRRGVTDHNGPAAGDLQTNATLRKGDSKMADANTAPVDEVEGEFNMENYMGVGLSLLRGLASIQAGDMARVECLLLDDMVRILSRTYKHHSAFGDLKIVNDGGRLNVEWNGTSLDHEAWGELKPGDAKAKLDNNGDKVNMTDGVDGYNDDGRWRFSQYIGWLGDFINVFVTDPVNAIGKLAADQLRGGKAHIHINNDGAVLIQSVADIVLEKVVRIPVPIRLKRDEDPTGNRSDDSVRNTDQLAQWKPSDDSNIFEMAFQLREYSRWLNNMHSLSRFRQLSHDFKVPTESQTPAPDLNSGEVDKKTVNSGITNWRIAYSCIRIYRDGSVQTVDAYGNSMLTTKTGILISSTKSITLQAAGSVNIVAGRDINILAKQNVGITAVTDKVRLKAKAGIWMLVESGKFIMECLAAGKLYLKNAALNVANNLTVATTGNVETVGVVTALQMAAPSTMTADDHTGHIFPGSPQPVSDSDEFKFQEQYGDNQLYQTFSQAALERGEQESDGEWDFSGNVVSGKGAPWPGASAQEKKAVGGTNLNQPSSAAATAKPKALSMATIKMKVQS